MSREVEWLETAKTNSALEKLVAMVNELDNIRRDYSGAVAGALSSALYDLEDAVNAMTKQHKEEE